MLRPGGHIVIYAPNRLYPFETHGIYLGKRFIFGNIPFVNWLPDPLRNRLVPHARAYTKSGIRTHVRGTCGARVDVESYVYPGFDNIIARRKRLGGVLRAVLYRAEHTPLRMFGLSHFVVLEKPARSGRGRRQRGVGTRTSPRGGCFAAGCAATASGQRPVGGIAAGSCRLAIALAGLGIIARRRRRRDRLRRLPLVRQRPRSRRTR